MAAKADKSDSAVSDTLDPETAAFLHEWIESYEQLEVLVALHSKPKVAWSLPTIVEKLGLDASAAAYALDRLRSRSLVRANDGVYQVAPRDLAQARALARLASIYAVDPLDVIRWMNANAVERIRRGTAVHRVVSAKKEPT